MTAAARLTRRGTGVVFAAFAFAALAKYLIVTNEAPSSRGSNGEPEAVLVLGYLLATGLAFAGPRWGRSGPQGWGRAMGRIMSVGGLCALAFWLVDRSQKFPIGEGVYGTRTVTLLALAGAALLAAVALATRDPVDV